MRLWEILKYYIETGQEARKVDLKQTLDLSSKKKEPNLPRISPQWQTPEVALAI